MKKYYIQNSIGKSKYVVSYCSGETKHQDGSLFWDIRIFKNKKNLNLFEKSLLSEGYTYN